MFKQYWYLTAYFGLFLLMPVLNIAANHLIKNQYKVIIIAGVLFFSIGQTFFHIDTFSFNWGLSAWWLMILYLIGGYIRKYGLFSSIKKIWLILLYIGTVVLMWFGKYIVEYVTAQYFGGFKSGFLLFNNTSPMVLLSAILLFLIFERMSIKNTKLIKAISICSPSAFSVYLIHDHPLVRENIITDRFAVFSQFPIPLMMLAVIGTSVGIYVVCSAIDLLREMLFKALKIKKRLQKIENRVMKDLWRM